MDVPYLCTITVPLSYHYYTITAAAGAANAAVRSDLYNHIRIICSHYWCPDMRFGRRRQPLVRHRGRLSLRCKNDYPPPPNPKGGIAPRPLSAHARRGGPVVGPPQHLLPMGPLQVPVGRNILFTTCSNHVQTILTNFKTMDRRDRAHNRI